MPVFGFGSISFFIYCSYIVREGFNKKTLKDMEFSIDILVFSFLDELDHSDHLCIFFWKKT